MIKISDKCFNEARKKLLIQLDSNQEISNEELAFYDLTTYMSNHKEATSLNDFISLPFCIVTPSGKTLTSSN